MVKKKTVIILALGACLIGSNILSGCALFPFVIPAGVVQYQQTFAEADIPELAQRPDVIDLAAQVGKSLGYEISLKTDETLVLSRETLAYIEPITGEYRSTNVFVYKVQTAVNGNSPKKDSEDEILRRVAPSKFQNQTVHLAVYGGGVYYTNDSQQKVNALMTEFKDKLLTFTGSGKSIN